MYNPKLSKSIPSHSTLSFVNEMHVMVLLFLHNQGRRKQKKPGELYDCMQKWTTEGQEGETQERGRICSCD